jgi:hypothetical protein
MCRGNTCGNSMRDSKLVSDYVDDGRKLQQADGALLDKIWRACAKAGSDPNLSASDKQAILTMLNDVEAELSLRGLVPPAPRDKKELH